MRLHKKGACILVMLLFLPLSMLLNVEGSKIEGYELLWSYDIGSTVDSVSISANGKRIAAVGGNMVYFLDSEGGLLWKYKIRNDCSKDLYEREVFLHVSSNGEYVAVLDVRGWILTDRIFLILNRDGNVLFNCRDCLRYGSVSDKGSFVMLVPGELFKPDLISYYDSLSFPRSRKWEYEVDNGLKVLMSLDGNYMLALWFREENTHDTYYLTLLNKYGEKLWDYKVGTETWLSWTNIKYVMYYSFSISADGGRITFATPEEIRMIDKNGDLLIRYERPIKYPDSQSLSLSPDGDYIVYAAQNETHYTFIIINSKGEWGWVAKGKVSSAAVSWYADYIVAASYSKVYLFAKSSIAKIYKARRAIEAATTAISNEKSKGFIATDAEDLLSRAKTLFNLGDYLEAKRLADQAYSLAIDVDQDNVPNSDDFSPYINNSHIYAGVAGSFLAAVLAGYAYARTRKRRIYVFNKETGELTIHVS
jgi:tetratricopeptide (TPR) repeat protein